MTDTDLRLEVVQVPVSDVDRAKAFYTDNLGFVLDHDVEHMPGIRVVQLTPPGSHCSIVIGTGMASMVPGSLEGLQLVVPDMDEARTELLRRGAPVSEAQDLGGFAFAYLSDPDGNRWSSRKSGPSKTPSSPERRVSACAVAWLATFSVLMRHSPAGRAEFPHLCRRIPWPPRQAVAARRRAPPKLGRFGSARRGLRLLWWTVWPQDDKE